MSVFDSFSIWHSQRSYFHFKNPHTVWHEIKPFSDAVLDKMQLDEMVNRVYLATSHLKFICNSDILLTLSQSVIARGVILRVIIITVVQYYLMTFYIFIWFEVPEINQIVVTVVVNNDKSTLWDPTRDIMGYFNFTSYGWSTHIGEHCQTMLHAQYIMTSQKRIWY